MTANGEATTSAVGLAVAGQRRPLRAATPLKATLSKAEVATRRLALVERALSASDATEEDLGDRLGAWAFFRLSMPSVRSIAVDGGGVALDGATVAAILHLAEAVFVAFNAIADGGLLDTRAFSTREGDEVALRVNVASSRPIAPRWDAGPVRRVADAVGGTLECVLGPDRVTVRARVPVPGPSSRGKAGRACTDAPASTRPRGFSRRFSRRVA